MSEMEKAESAVAATSIKHREKLFSAWKQNNFQEVKPFMAAVREVKTGNVKEVGKVLALRLFGTRDEARAWMMEERNRARASRNLLGVTQIVGGEYRSDSSFAKKLAASMVSEVKKRAGIQNKQKHLEVKDRQMSMGF